MRLNVYKVSFAASASCLVCLLLWSMFKSRDQPTSASLTSSVGSPAEKISHKDKKRFTSLKEPLISKSRNAEVSAATAALSKADSKITSTRSDSADLKVQQPDLKSTISMLYDQMLSSDSKKIIQQPFVAAHQLMITEGVDPDWSPYANQAITDNVNSQFGDRLDFSMVDCRTDICEVRANSKLGSDYAADLRDVQSQISVFKEQSWYQQNFDDASFSVTFVDNQLPVMVIFLTRK